MAWNSWQRAGQWLAWCLEATSIKLTTFWCISVSDSSMTFNPEWLVSFPDSSYLSCYWFPVDSCFLFIYFIPGWIQSSLSPCNFILRPYLTAVQLIPCCVNDGGLLLLAGLWARWGLCYQGSRVEIQILRGLLRTSPRQAQQQVTNSNTMIESAGQALVASDSDWLLTTSPDQW